MLRYEFIILLLTNLVPYLKYIDLDMFSPFHTLNLLFHCRLVLFNI